MNFNKKLFELHINGKFTQYLLPSEVKLLKWEQCLEFKLIPVMVTTDRYNNVLGKNKTTKQDANK